MSMLSRSRFKVLGALGGALLAAGVGAPMVLFSVGDGLARRSYDLPFLWRSQIEITNVAIVYVDARTRQAQDPADPAAGRRQYAQLLERLRTDGADLVVLDILFERELDPTVDQALADSIRDHGKVVLGCFQDDAPHLTEGNTAAIQTLQLPAPRFRESATAIGLVGLHAAPVQRRMYAGSVNHPSIGWAAAAVAGAISPDLEKMRLNDRWINYYGPPYSVPSVSLADTLQTNGVPPGFFRGRTVFVGGHPAIYPSEGFQTPYTAHAREADSRLERALTSGVEIHATTFLNLTRGEWIEAVRPNSQLALVLAIGLLAGAGMALVRPWHAAWMTLAAAILITATSFVLQWEAQRTWSWLTPAVLQLPVALVWSVGFQYAVEGHRRRQIQKAFSAYLSPHLAQRIADSDFDLSPGGREVEATILFTDLEGFTAISEGRSPAEVSQLLIAYFSEITRHIWVHDGTIIKYIGDSVMAAWGAPLPDASGPEHGVLAACGILESGQKEFMGQRLRTRIGVNTGRVLAGNLGSPVRFDYTAIGATTNMASRLEGMNKALGTNILITEATRRQLSDRIRVRRLGPFRIKGFRDAAVIYEVLGTIEQIPALPLWLAVFEEAMGALAGRDWAGAEKGFRETSLLRGGQDGPSEFMLGFLAALRRRPEPDQAAWNGVLWVGKAD